MTFAKMARRFFGALWEMQQVKVDLDGSDARQPVAILLAGEHARVVGPDQLDVGSLRLLADFKKVRDCARIFVEVD
jgi:hypothetical protein